MTIEWLATITAGLIAAVAFGTLAVASIRALATAGFRLFAIESVVGTALVFLFGAGGGVIFGWLVNRLLFWFRLPADERAIGSRLRIALSPGSSCDDPNRFLGVAMVVVLVASILGFPLVFLIAKSTWS